jgi:hypothetical protein
MRTSAAGRYGRVPFWNGCQKKNSRCGGDGHSARRNARRAHRGFGPPADRPSDFRQRTQYDSKHGAGVTVDREGRGQYLVIPAGSGGPTKTNGGNVEVSAVGTSDARCYVHDWAQGTNPDIDVDCVNRLGVRADSAFTIQWVVA